MKASFIIGFHTARIDNLLQTLRFLVQETVIKECELVTVCQDTVNQLRTHDLLKFDELSLKFKKVKHFDLNLPYMQLPAITNYGVEQSSSDKLIVLESDRVLPDQYFGTVIDQLCPGMQITTKKMFKLSHPADDLMINARQFDYSEEYRSEENEIGQRNIWSGNTALMKSDFYRAGKMDEAYIGYGWADSDMTYAMESVGVQSIYRDEIELHLWHEPATYGDGNQKKMFIDNGLRFCRKWHQTIPGWLRVEISEHREELI